MKQKILQQGFTDFKGNMWCEVWVNTYNMFTEKINQARGESREFLLDQRHRLFVSYLELSKEKRMMRL
jgi:hypothetical protein